jgi:predicted  nucleic acid-binding Zn-ribbon protein
MSDETPNTEPSGGSEILDELREMGKNLREALQGAWESEERKKLQKEIEDGLNEVSAGLSQAARDFKESQPGQTIKTEMADFKERMRTGEVESKVRNEVLDALRMVNEELRKVGKKEN